jgi:putative acetyltransferase
MVQPTERFAEVEPLRAASRQVVRELGMLDDRGLPAHISHSQCHALIELERAGGEGLGVAELATRLNLDKSTLSRTVARLARAGLVTHGSGPDRRKKPLRLTAAGRKKLASVHQAAGGQVHAALELLAPAERQQVLDGMTLYARALGRLRGQREVTVRAIQRRDDPQVAAIIRQVMPEFGAVGDGYSVMDPEVDAMSAAYPPPRAAYWVLEERGGRLLGGGGFGPLAGAAGEICEVRKMYFLPEARGLGLGRALLARILDAAKGAGYRTAYLETLEHMTAARALYASFGFEPRKGPLGATGHFGCNAWYSRAL